jgi:hypothetical protein
VLESIAILAARGENHVSRADVHVAWSGGCAMPERSNPPYESPMTRGKRCKRPNQHEQRRHERAEPALQAAWRAEAN